MGSDINWRRIDFWVVTYFGCVLLSLIITSHCNVLLFCVETLFSDVFYLVHFLQEIFEIAKILQISPFSQML